MEEPTASQHMAAESLAKLAKERCDLVGIQTKYCDKKRFLPIVLDYYEKASGMRSHLKDCIQWCCDHDVRVFRPTRFRNWCKNHVRYAKLDKQRKYEEEKLKNGNEHQRAEYHRLRGRVQAGREDRKSKPMG